MKRMKPADLKLLTWTYAPYIGAGVRIVHVAADWTEVSVEMPLRWYNRNYVGTHFGGSLYSMVDPFMMLMAIHQLGEEYIVWDKAAEIDFIKPGKGVVRSTMRLEQTHIDHIKAQTQNGEKALPEFQIEILDEAGEVVAKVRKVLYVRKKRDD